MYLAYIFGLQIQNFPSYAYVCPVFLHDKNGSKSWPFLMHGFVKLLKILSFHSGIIIMKDLHTIPKQKSKDIKTFHFWHLIFFGQQC